jgi:hypothetical protein
MVHYLRIRMKKVDLERWMAILKSENALATVLDPIIPDCPPVVNTLAN